MYICIAEFVDLLDNRHKYHEGDEYPRSGTAVFKDRVLELMSDKNKARKPLIKEVIEAENGVQTAEPEEKPKPTRKKVARKTKE